MTYHRNFNNPLAIWTAFGGRGSVTVATPTLNWSKKYYNDFGYTQYGSETQIDVYDNGSAQIAVYYAKTPISANVSWAVTKRFSQGIPHIPTTYFLGYDEDEEGNLIINEEEAKIVRRIYRELLDGKGTGLIAKGLTKDKVKTARGNTKWTSDSVLKILRNEKFAGHVLCQKTVTLDPLTHKRVRNKNHKPQYFIRNHHPPIIPEDEWNEVQMELDRRNKMHHDPDGKYRSAYSGRAPFSISYFVDYVECL